MPTFDVHSALEQVESCAFECEAGALANNVGWTWLRDRLSVGPRFLPGQLVWVQLFAEVSGEKLNGWGRFTIVGCRMSSDTERRTWTYDLSNDPPEAYHYGTVTESAVLESRLSATGPIAAAESAS